MALERAVGLLKGFTQISRKGAAANKADFAKRLLADIYAKSAKLTAAQPPHSCDFEDNPTALTSFETAEVFLVAASVLAHIFINAATSPFLQQAKCCQIGVR